MTQIDRGATLAQIVTEHPTAARVFQRYGLDYCCHGDVSVEEACAGPRLDADALFSELEDAVREPRPDGWDDPRSLSPLALVSLIVDRHHAYARHAVPNVAALVGKVVRAHASKDPGLLELQGAVRELSEALLPHLDDEEEVLFPAVIAKTPDRRLVERELDAMQAEHLAVGDRLARIRRLAHGFVVPEWGCTTYRVLMAELEALEADTLRHVHLENHVLAPMASSRAA
jgi:regulator of cell morphogenesis and NO signaling